MAFDALTRRAFLEGAAAATLAGGLVTPAFAKDLVVGFLYVGPKDDYGYNQAHAEGAAAVKTMPGVKLLEEEQVEHDRARRRDALVPDQLRLFRSARDQDGGEISQDRVPPLRRPVAEGQAPEERRLLLRLHRHGTIFERHRRRPRVENEEARLRRRQADPAGAAEHQQLYARRALGRSRHHHAGDFHRRMVAAGE